MVNAPPERLNVAGSAAYVHGSGMYALAEKLHHSAGPVEQHDALRRQKNARARQEGEEHGTYDAPRGLSAPLPGTRPAPPPEVAGPQGRPVAPLSPGAGVLSLASPALAGAADEVVDSSALAFLAARAVQVREEEEEAEELRQLDEVLATAEDRLVEALDPLRHDDSRPRWKPLVTGTRLGSEERRGRGGRRGGGPGRPGGRGFLWLRFLLRPFVLFWLRFPGKHSGRARFVQRLYSLGERAIVRLCLLRCFQ